MRPHGLIAALLSALVTLVAMHAAALDQTVQRMDLGNGVTVTLAMAPFDPEAHDIVQCASGAPCVIDGAPVFGTDGVLPTRTVTLLQVRYDAASVDLDHRGMFNAWSPFDDDRPHLTVMYRDADGLRLRGSFSDGSAAYVAEWLILGDASVRTRIDCVECNDPSAFEPKSTE